MEKNLVEGLNLPGIFVAPQLEHPTGVTEVVDSISSWNSEIFSVVPLPVAKHLAIRFLVHFFARKESLKFLHKQDSFFFFSFVANHPQFCLIQLYPQETKFKTGKKGIYGNSRSP